MRVPAQRLLRCIKGEEVLTIRLPKSMEQVGGVDGEVLELREDPSVNHDITSPD